MRTLIASVLILAIGGLAAAQWGTGGCATVVAPGPVYTWKKRADVPSESYLFLGNVQVGAYCHDRDVYMPIVGECDCGPAGRCRPCDCGWGAPCTPPIPPPAFAGRPNVNAGQPPTGVNWERIPNEDSAQINGKPATFGEVRLKLIEGLADDSGKPHLTAVVKDPAQRKQVVADVAAGSLASQYRVQIYDPASPIDAAILEPFQLDRDERFQKSGLVVLVQDPAGKDGRSKPRVIYAYQGPDDLAEQLRKKDRDYDPSKKAPDKDAKLPLLPFPSLPKPNVQVTVSPWLIAAGGIAVLLILMARKK